MGGGFFIALSFFVLGLIFLLKTFRVVPQQNAWVVERLGKYHRTLNAGLHIIIPFFDRVAYRHNLKEVALDIAEQICITRDNVQVGIDGVIFFKVIDPQKAAYGVANFIPALIQLAQTTLRSEIGRLELDRTFEERAKINQEVVAAIDDASDTWGVKVLRYEIKSISPPRDVLDAMEKQMRAEREKRAQILSSEGDRDSKINRAEGVKQETIKNSEAEMQKRINEATGQAEAIRNIAKATADGLKMIAEAISHNGGMEAVKLRVAEEYIQKFGELAKASTTMIVPASTSDLSGMIATSMSIFEGSKNK